MSSKTFFTQHCKLITQHCYQYAVITMHSCCCCKNAEVVCWINHEYSKCKECYWWNWKCNLTPDYENMNKVIQKVNKLDDEILKMQQKLICQKRQQKFWLHWLHELEDKKFKNILKLKENEEIMKTSIKTTMMKKMSDVMKNSDLDSLLMKMLSDNLNDFLWDLSSVKESVDSSS